MAEEGVEVVELSADPQFAYFSIWKKDDTVKVLVNTNCGASLVRDFAIKSLIHALDSRIQEEMRKAAEEEERKRIEAQRKAIEDANAAAEAEAAAERGEEVPEPIATEPTEGEGEASEKGPDIVEMMNELKIRLIEEELSVVSAETGEEVNIDEKLNAGSEYSFCYSTVKDVGEGEEPSREVIQLLTE